MNDLRASIDILKQYAEELRAGPHLPEEARDAMLAIAADLDRWAPVLERAQELAAIERYWSDNPEEAEEALEHLLGNGKPESRRMSAIIRLVMAVASAQRGEV